MGADRTISRRDVLRAMGMAGGVAWSAPKLASLPPRAAVAGSPPPANSLEITGDASGVTFAFPDDLACPDASGRANSVGSFSTAGLGNGDFDLDYCFQILGPNFSFAGTFTLTTPGGTLRGQLSGSGGSPPSGVHVRQILTIDTGTGALTDAEGTSIFDGTLFQNGDRYTVSGAIRLPA